MIFLLKSERNVSNILPEFGWAAPKDSIDIHLNMKYGKVALFALMPGQSGPPYEGKAGHLEKYMKNIFNGNE